MKKQGLQNFQIISRLGEGSFGQVFKVKRIQDSEIYALKKIKLLHMNQKDRNNALNEIRILASYSGSNIIGYKESFYEESTNSLCIILQYAGQGDLLYKINQFKKESKFLPEQQIWKAMVEITLGLHSLHQKKILHRDLKSANIFIMEDGTYKLGDLNVSKVLKYDMAKTQTGTPYYCSPQVWKDRPYNAKSDMWSLGCVLYEMAAQRPPFLANDIPSLFRKISAGHFPRIPQQYSNQLFNFIKILLSQNPNRRPSAIQLLSSQQVEWRYEKSISFQKHNKNSLLNTIKPTHNLKNLNKNLPKPKYESFIAQIQRDNQTSKQKSPVNRSYSYKKRQKSVKDILNDKKVDNYIRNANKMNSNQKRDKSKSITKKNQIQKQKSSSKDRIKIHSIQFMQQQVQALAQQCLNKRKPYSHQNLPPPTPNRKMSKKNIPPIPSPQIVKKYIISPPTPPVPSIPVRKHIFSRKSSQKSLEEYQKDRSLSRKNSNKSIQRNNPTYIDEIMRRYRDE